MRQYRRNSEQEQEMNEIDDDEGTVLDDYVSPFDGMHSSHPELKRDATEDIRKVDGAHPVVVNHKKDKRRVREALGGVCDHCGEDEQGLLDVHHVLYDGAQQRSMGAIPMWRRIRREVLAGSKDYQLLCKPCHRKLH